MKAKKVLFTLILLAGVLLLCLAVLEISVRLFFRAEVLGSRMPLVYQYDDRLGHTYRPGAVGFMSRHGEIFSQVAINDAGFRDYDYSERKPPGVFRIAVIGDSFVTGNQVPLEKIFPKILERELRKGVDPGIEVLNFGVDGYGPREERLLYELRIEAYRPDLVIQCVFPFNDVEDVKRGRAYRIEYRGAVLKYKTEAQCDLLKAERDQELMEERSEQALGPLGRFLQEKLWIVRFFKGRHLKNTPELPQKALQLDESRLPAIDRDPGAFSPAFSAALKETKSLILALNRRVLDAGARFALVIIPADLEVSLAEWGTKRFTLSPGLFQKAMHRGCLHFEAFARNHGIPVLNLLPPFRSQYEERSLYWNYDAHWTEDGHRLAATCLSAFLSKNNLLQIPE